MAASTTMKTWTWRMRKNASALSHDTQHRAYRRMLCRNATSLRCSASRRHRDPAVDLAKKPAPPPRSSRLAQDRRIVLSRIRRFSKTKRYSSVDNPHVLQGQLLPGDLQVVRAQTHAVAHDGLVGAALYFRAPADRALALGPEVLAPTFSTVATTPTLRLRARLAEQQEYYH